MLTKGFLRRGAPFDVLSSVLSLAATLPAVYGIKEWAVNATELGWIDCIVVGVTLGAVFGRRKPSHPHAMIDADLLRNRVFITAVGTNAISTFALVGECGLHDGLPPAGARLQPAAGRAVEPGA